MKRGELKKILQKIMTGERLSQSDLAERSTVNRGTINEILMKEPDKNVLTSTVNNIAFAFPDYFENDRTDTVAESQQPYEKIKTVRWESHLPEIQPAKLPRVKEPRPTDHIIDTYKDLVDDLKEHNKLLLEHIKLLSQKKVPI